MVKLEVFMIEPVKLSHFDVVSIDGSKSPISATTFKVTELTAYAASKICNSFGLEIAKEWSLIGVPCEVLIRGGQDWQAGKVRLSLEFIPDTEEEKGEELTEEYTESSDEYERY